MACALSATICFFGLKGLWFARAGAFSIKHILFSSQQKDQKAGALKDHSFPILVNLQAESGGPRPARMQVHISLQPTANEQELLSLGAETFKNHFSFILSGKSAKDISDKKERFERQILSQLNAFLPSDPIKKVKIQTGALN